MCRVLMYYGQPMLIEDLLYKPDNSLVRQTYEPKFMKGILNLAGFGMAAWPYGNEKKQDPILYRTTLLPFYDSNLENLSSNLSARCVLAHVRGAAFGVKQVVTRQNAHPFWYEGADIAMAHNGALVDFDDFKYDLLDLIHPEIAKQIRGTTDTEWIYAMLLSQLDQKKKHHSIREVCNALIKTLELLKEIRKQYKIAVASSVNLFISNGSYLIATRYMFDYGYSKPKWGRYDLIYNSLWYTLGSSYRMDQGYYKMMGASNKKASVIIASEPLTEDTTTWIEVPEYSLMTVQVDHGELELHTENIDL